MPAGAQSTHISARFLAPDLYEQGTDTEVSCPLYLGADLVEPTEAGSTVTIYRRSGAKVVDAGPVTISGSIARYTLSGATSAALAREKGWRTEWRLLVSGSYLPPIRNDAALVKNRLYPVVTDLDLFRLHRSLDPSLPGCITSRENYQDERDEAWGWVQTRLYNSGNRPHLVMSPSALREVTLFKALELVFADMALQRQEYREDADRYERKAASAWKTLTFEYDSDDDGQSDDVDTRRGSSGTFWLTARA